MNAERFRISDHVLRKAANDQNRASVAGPGMVLSAFASELYLKCIFALETGRVTDGHELRTLFNLLSEERRLEIEQRWDAYNDTQDRRRLYATIENFEGAAIPRDLRWSLRKGNDAFTQLRYIHEPEMQNAIFVLGDFPGILRQVIISIRPEWAVLSHGPLKKIRVVDPAAADNDSKAAGVHAQVYDEVGRLPTPADHHDL